MGIEILVFWRLTWWEWNWIRGKSWWILDLGPLQINWDRKRARKKWRKTQADLR